MDSLVVSSRQLIYNKMYYLSARGGGPGAKPAPKYLYHYTDAKSAAKIEASGQLKPSSTGQLGKGTYLTSM